MITNPLSRTEPAVVIGLIVAFVATTISLVVAFGVDLTTEQQGAILATVTALAAIVQAFLTRGQVYAPDTVDDIVTSAVATAKDDRVPGPDHLADT